jgi:hypothetical protein
MKWKLTNKINTKTKMKKVVFFISSILLIGCNNDSSITVKKQDADYKSAFEAGGQSEEELEKRLAKIKEEEEKRKEETLKNVTTLSFNEMLHDYGTIGQESSNVTYFEVTNTGEKPLIIDKVEASCGCTTPEKPEKPIMPGKKDKIKVVFKPKPGQTGQQNKTVTVSANTDPKLTVLKIKAFVK